MSASEEVGEAERGRSRAVPPLKSQYAMEREKEE